MALYLDGKKYNITLGNGSNKVKDEQIKSLDVSTNGTYTIQPDEGKVLSSAIVNVEVPNGVKGEQEKTLNIIANGEYDILPDNGMTISSAKINVDVPIPEGYIVPTGELEITENGTHDVTEHASVVVNVVGNDWTIDDLVTGAAPCGDIVYNETNFNSQCINNLFAYRPNITSVVMENYTGSIPSFRNCSSLTWFYFPKCTSSTGQGLNSTGFSGTVYLNKMAPALTKLGSPTFNGLQKVTRIIFPETIQTFVANTINTPMSALTSICILGVPTTMPATTFNSNITSITDIYVPWAEGEVDNAPWGATNATVHYNTTFDENGDPVI